MKSRTNTDTYKVIYKQKYIQKHKKLKKKKYKKNKTRTHKTLKNKANT